MSDQLTVTPVVLEPAAQTFADATADPPYLPDLGPVEGRIGLDDLAALDLIDSPGRRADRDRRRLGRRQHDGRTDPDGQRAVRPEPGRAAAVLPGHGRELRHRLLPGVRHRLLPAPRRDAAVLGEAYGRKLRAAGVDVTATRYEGVIHDFVMLNALRETNAAQAAMAQAIAYLKNALA